MAKDKQGYPLEKGQFITYAIRSGNVGCLRIGRIEKVYERTDPWNNSRKIHVIQVQGCSKNHLDVWSLDKKGTVTSLENVLVIVPEMLSSDIRKIYV